MFLQQDVLLFSKGKAECEVTSQHQIIVLTKMLPNL